MNLIAYGSLMHPAEFASLAPQSAIPVWVHGFRRAFDQRPMWRGDGNSDHTVLAVRPAPAARFNGILLIDIPAEFVARLDYRERGYVRTRIPIHRLEPFGLEHFPALPSKMSGGDLYVGRDAQRSPSCSPLADYHALCRAACASWGEAFANSFDQTTLGGDP